MFAVLMCTLSSNKLKCFTFYYDLAHLNTCNTCSTHWYRQPRYTLQATTGDQYTIAFSMYCLSHLQLNDHSTLQQEPLLHCAQGFLITTN